MMFYIVSVFSSYPVYIRGESFSGLLVNRMPDFLYASKCLNFKNLLRMYKRVARYISGLIMKISAVV